MRNSLPSHIKELMSQHKPSDFEVIGFDLGHGKTALASIRGDAKTPPEIIELDGKRFQMTAYAKERKTNIITIGERAYQSIEYDQNRVSDFEIGFKDKPSDKNRIKIKTFVEAIHERVKDKLHSSLTPLFFIGHPSGWGEEVGQAYCQLFCEAGITTGVDVKESRAALMHARDSGAFTVSQLNKPILVIDIGSSTTDFTLVDGEKAEDYGRNDYPLGGSLIDKAILKYSLEHDNTQNKDRIEQIFEQVPMKNKQFQITSRQIKEEYFSNYKTYRDNPKRDIRLFSMIPRRMIDENLEFTWKINTTIMSEILAQPLETLDDKSWKQAFEDELKAVKQKFDTKKIYPTTIYISGGAYRMYFVREICEDVFCQDQKTIIVPANEPETDVAKGLASWGKHYVATAKFRLEVGQFVDKDLKGITEEDIPTLINSLAGLMTNDLIDKVIRPCIKDWKQGRINSLEGLEANIKQKAKEFLKGDALNKQVRESVTKWGAKLLQKVGKKINSIGTKYGLPEGTLGFLVDKSLLNNPHKGVIDSFTLPPVLEDIVGPITGVIVAAIVAIIDLMIDAIALSTGGPFAAGIFAVIVYFLGKGELEKKIKKWDNIHPSIRGLLLSDQKIDSTIDEQKHKIETIFKEKLNGDDKLKSDLIDDSKKSIQAAVEDQAERAAFLLE